MASVAVQKRDAGEAGTIARRGLDPRTFTLPEQTDAEHVKAELKNGELTIVVPKTAAVVAKRIPVAAGDKPKA